MRAELPSFDEAMAVVTALARRVDPTRLATERVKLAEAAGRVTARPVVADQDQPPFTRSTRDGFACRAAEAAAYTLLPVAGATHAGEAPGGPLPPGAAWEIMTGAPMPAGANAVVMLEHVGREGGAIRLQPQRTISTGENLVAQGAQARRGDEMIPAGALIGQAQIALAAVCGCVALDVYARPRVAILTTGDELVPVEAVPGPGQIRNSNAPMLAALVAAAGGEPWMLPAAADTAEALDAALLKTTEADFLLVSGGVSAGKFDLVEPALARLDARFHFTGVRIQPGKPLVFGEVLRTADDAGKLLFFGLPGNPISSAVTFKLFAAPVLAALAGRTELGPRFGLAQLARGHFHGSGPDILRAKHDLTRFLPARCDFNPPNGAYPQVDVLPSHGSGDLPAFARANCFVIVPEGADTFEAGAMIRILIV